MIKKALGPLLPKGTLRERPGATRSTGAVPQLGDESRFESLKSLAAARRRALDCARGVTRTDVDDDGWWDGVERSKHEGPRNTPVVWGNDFALIFPLSNLNLVSVSGMA